MPGKDLNKHEIKTRETRALLFEAAEKIFVRDGYEGADLAEIAAIAGRTKGAIYAQFKSKEDIFIALIEERRMRYQNEMEKFLAKAMTVDENLEAFRRLYLKMSEDTAWSLLMLEFKLFAMRHPKSKKRLQDLLQEHLSKGDEKRLASILGPAGSSKQSISRVAAVQILMTLLAALVLEGQLGSVVAKPSILKRAALQIFDSLLEVSSE